MEVVMPLRPPYPQLSPHGAPPSRQAAVTPVLRRSRPLSGSPTKRSVSQRAHSNAPLRHHGLAGLLLFPGDLLICPRWRGPLLSWQQQMNVPTRTIFGFSIPPALSWYSGWVGIGGGWWKAWPLWQVRGDGHRVLQQPPRPSLHSFISLYSKRQLLCLPKYPNAS